MSARRWRGCKPSRDYSLSSISRWNRSAPLPATIILGLVTNGWDRPPLQSTQLGYRGTGMAQVTNLRRYIETPTAQLPPPIPEVPAGGPMATEQFKNLTVLTDVSSAELLRIMAAITAWVSPKEGCNYCHEGADLASDAKYTKVVARA